MPFPFPTAGERFTSTSTRSLLHLVLMLATLLCVTACMEPPHEIGRKKGSEKVLHIDLPAPFGSLNPLDDLDSGSVVIYPFLYSRLFIMTREGKLEPDVASHWSYKNTSRTWTVIIRSEVFFHSGQPVTADDVSYSLLNFLKNAYPAYHPLIERVFVSSANCLEVTLKTDDEGFLERIWQMPILPSPQKNQANGNRHREPNGSGPLKYDYRVGNEEIGLTANEHAFRGRPSIDRVVFHYQANSQNSLARLLKGETDIALGLTPKDWSILDRYRDQFHLKATILPNYMVLLFNTSDPLFQSSKVRWALSQAINRGYLVDKIMKGFAEVAVGPIAIFSPFHDPEIRPAQYDPTHALELMKEEGWKDHPNGGLSKNGRSFEFTILIFEGYEQHQKTAEYIQLCLNDLGVRARLKPLRHDQLVERYGHNDEFQAVLTEFKGIDMSLDLQPRLWGTTGGKPPQAGGFSDSEVDRLIHQAVTEKVLDEKIELLHKFEHRLVSVQPGAFLFHPIATDIISKRVVLPSRILPDEQGYLAIAYADLRQSSQTPK